MSFFARGVVAAIGWGLESLEPCSYILRRRSETRLILPSINILNLILKNRDHPENIVELALRVPLAHKRLHLVETRLALQILLNLLLHQSLVSLRKLWQRPLLPQHELNLVI